MKQKSKPFEPSWKVKKTVDEERKSRSNTTFHENNF